MSTRRHTAANDVVATVVTSKDNQMQQRDTLEVVATSGVGFPMESEVRREQSQVSQGALLRKLLPMAYLPFMCAIATTESVWTIVPLYLQKNFNMTRSEISATMTLRSVGRAFASTPGGWVNSMTGLKVGIMMAFLVISGSFMTMAFAATNIVIQASLVSLGMGEEWYHIGLHTFISMNVSPSMRGRSMGVLGLCKSISGVAGPVLFASISTTFSSQNNIGLLSMAAVVLVAIALHSCCLPSIMGRILKAKEDGNNIGESTRKDGLICRMLRQHGQDFLRIVPFLCGLRAVRQGNLMLNALICLGSGYELSEISLVTSALLASIGVSSQLGAFLMDKFSPKLTAKIGLSVMTTSFITIALGLILPICQDPTTGYMYFGFHLTGVIVFGIGQGLMQGTFTVISANKVSKEYRSLFLGMLKTASSLAGILSVLMVGYFDSKSTSEGTSTAAFCLAGCSAVSLFWVQFFLGDVSRKKSHRKKSTVLADTLSDEEKEERAPMISKILSRSRRLVRSSSYSTLKEIRDAAHTGMDNNQNKDEEEPFWIQLEEPFFPLGSNMDEVSFNEFRRNYLQYRAGASHGAQGEVTAAV
jgi:MFS family permease